VRTTDANGNRLYSVGGIGTRFTPKHNKEEASSYGENTPKAQRNQYEALWCKVKRKEDTRDLLTAVQITLGEGDTREGGGGECRRRKRGYGEEEDGVGREKGRLNFAATWRGRTLGTVGSRKGAFTKGKRQSLNAPKPGRRHGAGTLRGPKGRRFFGACTLKRRSTVENGGLNTHGKCQRGLVGKKGSGAGGGVRNGTEKISGLRAQLEIRQGGGKRWGSSSADPSLRNKKGGGPKLAEARELYLKMQLNPSIARLETYVRKGEKSPIVRSENFGGHKDKKRNSEYTQIAYCQEQGKKRQYYSERKNVSFAHAIYHSLSKGYRANDWGWR